MTIRDARPADVSVICTLLDGYDLPTDVEAHLCDFLVAEHEGQTAGVIGLERCGNDGLLRSLAVARPFRGQRLGDALCEELYAHARTSGIGRLYLLTTTAREFFLRQGFVEIARDAVPGPIAATREFRELCPASATCMRRDL